MVSRSDQDEIVEVHVVPLEPGQPGVEIVYSDGQRQVRKFKEGDVRLLMRFAGKKVLPRHLRDKQ